jgi:hypothetical protein
MAWYEYEPTKQRLYHQPSESLSFKNSLSIFFGLMSTALLPIVLVGTLFLLIRWLRS